MRSRRRPSCRSGRRRRSRPCTRTRCARSAHVVLGNAYHLHFRPGEDVIEELGGLHLLRLGGPILTDSGGYQVFSLRDTLLAVDEDGVTFRSVYDGSPERFTPESTAEIQRRLGSDIAMCLDVCPPADVSPAELERAVELTTTWARRQSERRARSDSCASGSRREVLMPSCAAVRSRKSRRCRSTGMPSAGWLSARTGRRCWTRSPGRRRCSRSSRATSWASGTPRASSR